MEQVKEITLLCTSNYNSSENSFAFSPIIDSFSLRDLISVIIGVAAGGLFRGLIFKLLISSFNVSIIL